jgi:hypothetical protein
VQKALEGTEAGRAAVKEGSVEERAEKMVRGVWEEVTA